MINIRRVLFFTSKFDDIFVKEICNRSLTPVCSNWSMVKLVLLYVVLLKVTVSKDPSMLSEDLLYSSYNTHNFT